MCGRGSRRKTKSKHAKNDKEDIEDWGSYMAIKKAKLLDQFHSDNIEKVSEIFAGVRILVNGLTHPPASELKNLMAAHGGEYHMYQVSSTTHIIASNLPNVKIKHLGAVPIVKPAWITESIALNKLLDYKRYLLYTNQSRLQPALNFPIVPKAPGIETFNARTADEETMRIDELKNGDENLPQAESISMTKEENKQTSVTNDDPTNKLSVSKNVSNISNNSSSHNAGTRVTKTASDPKFLEEFYNNSRLHLISTLGAEFKQLVGQLREKSDGKFPGREKLIAQKGKPNATHTVPPSVVMHIDMDCFFVSVGLRSHPELRGQPVAITHARSAVLNTSDPSRQAIRDQEFALYEERLPEGASSRVVDIKERIDGLASMSEIASCSYEARQYGIKNGMFLGQAIKLCPGLKTLPYDFEGYREVSNILYNTVATYTLDIEAVSCDEMYVDVKKILIDTGLTVEEWATHIRSEIMDITGCPCSTGFGANRLQARLATRKAKPAGQYYLKPEHVETYISEISLADLPGVGRATLAKLRHLGFHTCGDLQNGSLKHLQTELGNKLGERIWDQAHGKDNKPLDFNHERKSVSAEINYGIRFKTKDECYNFLQSLANEVFNRLADINMKARGLTLKLLVRAEGAPVETAKFLGHGVCDVITKSSSSNMMFSSADLIYKEAKSIYDKLNVPFAELRGVGIQLSKLEKNARVNKALSNFLKQGVVKKRSHQLLETETCTAEQSRSIVHTSEIVLEPDKISLQIQSPKAFENTCLIPNIKTKIDQIDKLSSTSNNSKSVIKDVSSRSRGRSTRGRRGKNLATGKSMQSFLNIPKSGKVSNNLRKESDEDQESLLKLRDQIDLDVLNELPEDIRNEVMKEYRFDVKPQGNPTEKQSISKSKTQKPALNKPPESKIEKAETQNNEITSSTIRHSPFANQTWEQVKQGIKTWIRSEKDPAQVDVEMLADHLRQLAMDRRIEILHSGFNFLHRTFTNLSCSWHQAYFTFVNAVQQGMVATYGKVLHVETNFYCCHIN